MIILALYNSFSIPFELSFDPELMRGSMFFIFNSIIDLMFAIDIFVAFRTTYFHPITGAEVRDLKLIKKGYINGRFAVDFLSTVPFDTLFFFLTGGSDLQFLKVFSILKIIRVSRLSNMIARLNASEETKNFLKLC